MPQNPARELAGRELTTGEGQPIDAVTHLPTRTPC